MLPQPYEEDLNFYNSPGRNETVRLEETLPINIENEGSVLEKQNGCEFMPTKQTINRQKFAQHATNTLQSIDDFDASEEEPI